MIEPVGLFPARTSVITTGGQAITLIYGPVLGGIIVNPAAKEDQGIAEVEVLYVDVVGPAGLTSTATTTAIQPGQTYYVPANLTTNVSVNAATTGHKFSAVAFQPASEITPAEILGVENPCLQNVIPSYLYQQYSDDEDLQAWVSAFNTIAQQYVSWANAVMLPVYTGPLIVGDLLDWVAQGLYGIARPVLSAGNLSILGPLDTYGLNSIRLNGGRVIDTTVYTVVSDDIFKRILTWKLYKGDGKIIDVRWLKRRILRFLLGADGTDVNAGDTTKISVAFSDDNVVTLTVLNTEIVRVGNGSLFNANVFNGAGFNQRGGTQISQTISTYTHGNQIDISVSSALPNASIFKQAVEQGVLDMPFQFKAVVHIV